MSTISGIASILTDLAPCFVVLIKEADGTAVGNTQCAADGTYTFLGVAPGNYALAFIDPAGEYRGKIIHVTVAP